MARQAQAVTSAHKNPASSRAIAATTRFLEALRAGQPAQSGRTTAAAPGHARATTWVQALLAAGGLGADRGAVLVGPGRLDQLRAQVGVAGLGQLSAPGPLAAGAARLAPARRSP